MPRRRKVAEKEKENDGFVKPRNSKTKPPAKKQKKEPEWMTGNGATIINLMLSVQETDCNDAKVIAELTKLYNTMGHDSFMATFKRAVLFYVIRDENDDCATRVLKFIGNFIATFGEEVGDDGGSHPIILHVFNEILSISSKAYHIRARICTLVMNIMNSFSQKAEIDEEIMDLIIHRMVGTFIKDISPVVRQAAIMALQRLQDPDNLEDQVTKAYIFHMETDPVARVRQAAVTAIAKKLPAMPYILDRFSDNDEKVRRHTYLQMISFPVKGYKIADRIRILKAGLYDRSDMVKKTVLNLVLPNWVAAYNHDYAMFIKAFNLTANESDLKVFRSIAQDALSAIFKKKKISELIAYLEIPAETEFRSCISMDKAKSLEWLIIWKMALTLHQEHVSGKKVTNDQDEESDSSHGNSINESVSNIELLPELSVFCDFFEKFLNDFKVSDEVEAKHEKLIFNHCVIVLLEIAQLNDFGDEIGCNRLKNLCKKILMQHEVSEQGVQEVSKVMEILVPDVNLRLKFFNEIVFDTVNIGTPNEYSRQTIIDEIISKVNMDITLKANGLKMEMMELKEAEVNFVALKKYGDAQAVSEKYATLNAELIELLRPYAAESSTASQSLEESLASVPVAKKITPVDILKNLRICFFSVTSKGVKALTPEMVQIYKNFVCYYLESTDIMTRIWALKTATSYALLYEPLSKDVYTVLKAQLFKSSAILIWESVIGCIVDLLLRYSKDKMEAANDNDMSSSVSQNRSKKSGGRALYTDADDDDENELLEDVDIVTMLLQVLDNTVSLDMRVYRAVLIGMCKLVLHGQYCTKEIISKFLLAYFNPATEPEISQTLGIFFESIIRMRKQDSLHDALIPTMKILLEAPGDSPLREVKMETVIRYVIGATRPVFCSNGLNLHNTLGLKLIEMMKENPENKEIQKVVSKEIMLLEISDDSLLKKDMVALIETLLKETTADAKTKKNICDFRDLLLGTYKPPLKFSSTTATITTVDEDAGEPEDGEEEVEPENVTQPTVSGTISNEEVMDISLSDVNLQQAVVNVTKLHESQCNESSKVLVAESPSKSICKSPVSTQDVDIPEAQEPEELNATAIENVATDQSNDENKTIPETPESSLKAVTPKRKNLLTSKRHLEISMTHQSPLSKNPRNGASPKPATPRRSRAVPTTPSTPKTPHPDHTSTPNAERMTRRQTKEALALNSVLTRSRNLKLDIESKVLSSPKATEKKTEEPKQSKEKVAKQTLIPKPTKTSMIRSAKSSTALVPKPSTSHAAVTKSASESRITRKQAAADSKTRPRWN